MKLIVLVGCSFKKLDPLELSVCGCPLATNKEKKAIDRRWRIDGQFVLRLNVCRSLLLHKRQKVESMHHGDHVFRFLGYARRYLVTSLIINWPQNSKQER